MHYLGTTQRDKITGFQGVVISHCVNLTGNDQLLIQPVAVDVDGYGKFVEPQWFDLSRLEDQRKPVVKLSD